ncbi:MAG: Gfo/Idh/MocA family oxidoreductase [Mucilaginibacter sp.]
MSTINWGIIGCGDVTEVKSGPAFYKVAGSKVIAAMRRNAAKAADFAKRHNIGKWYDDGSKLINDAEINAIYIATPPSSHITYAIESMQKGHDVYIEKPIALNAGEVRKIAEVAKQTGCKVSIAHYRRAMTMFLHIKELIENGTIGEVRTVQMRLLQSAVPELITHVEDAWRVDPEVSGGGYFFDIAPHQLDIMLFLFGEAQYFNGLSLNQSHTNKVDDHTTGTILFKNGVVFSGVWSFNVAPAEAIDQCEIFGTKGKIVFPVFGNTVYWKNEDDEKNLTFDPGAHIAQPMVEQVINYFNGTQQHNPCSIDDALQSMEILNAFAQHR